MFLKFAAHQGVGALNSRSGTKLKSSTEGLLSSGSWDCFGPAGVVAHVAGCGQNLSFGDRAQFAR